MVKRYLLALIFFISIPLTTLAEVPNYLTQQGRILQPDNQPITGVESMTFSLYSGSVGGSPLWSETSSITFDDGYYSVILGTTESLSTDIFDGSDLYLGITLGNNDEMIPRHRITSVAYALVAGSVNGTVNAQGGLSVQGSQVIDENGLWVGDFDLSGNELRSARMENSSDAPVECNENAIGYVYFDTTAENFQGCDGTNWQILTSAVGDCPPGSAVSGISQDGTLNCINVNVLLGQSGTDVRDGSLDADEDIQETGLTDGHIMANWDAVSGATDYMIAIGTEPGGNDLLDFTSIGNVTSYDAEGLTLECLQTYYVSIKPFRLFMDSRVFLLSVCYDEPACG